jgi:tetratricopeptide (TPR) repeat protein
LETLDVAQAAAAYAQAPLGCTENQTVEKRLPFFVRNIALKLTKNQKQAAYALYQTMIGQATHLPPVSHAFAQQVKQAIDKQTQRAGGLTAAQQLTTMLIDLADLLDDDSVRALALRAQGNVYLYQQAYPDAIRCYRQAAALYTLHQQPLSAAEAEVGVVGALAQLGRYQEAEAVYQRISQLFARLEQWRPLAKVTGNLTILYNRQGRDREALAFADEAGRLLRRLGPTGLESLPLIENNRAISLRNLGRFADSIAASQSAYTLNQQLGQSAEGARAPSRPWPSPTFCAAITTERSNSMTKRTMPCALAVGCAMRWPASWKRPIVCSNCDALPPCCKNVTRSPRSFSGTRCRIFCCAPTSIRQPLTPASAPPIMPKPEQR